MMRDGAFQFGPFRLVERQHLLLRDGVPVPLRPKVFETLLVLVQNADRVVRKEELMSALWPDTIAAESNLTQNIWEIRRALSESEEGPKYIETVPRIGYRFVASVGAISDETAAAPAISEAPPVAPARRWTWLVALGSLALLAGAAVLLRKNALRPSAQPRPRRSVAVMGFKNLSGRPDASWLSTAFSEMLAVELAAGQGLHVLPGETVAQAKLDLKLPDSDDLQKATLERIRASLGPDLVVLGSYVALGKDEGGKIRLDIRLQDTGSGETVALLSETGAESELFELVSRSGAHLRDTLGLGGLSGPELRGLQASLPSSPEAARLYAEGLTSLRRFDALAARALLERAATAEPGRPFVHAALAGALTQLGYDARAIEESRKAFELSGSLSREDRLQAEAAYRATALQWDRAVECTQALWVLSPGNLEYGLKLAFAQARGGKASAALTTVAALRALPPPASNDPRIDLMEASAAQALGDFKRMYASAETAARKGLAKNARLLVARARWTMGMAAGDLGERAKALDALEEARAIYAEAGDRGMVAAVLNSTGYILDEQGDATKAQALFEEALGIARELGFKRLQAVTLNNLALSLFNRGDASGAKKRYEEALAIDRELGDKANAGIVLNNLGTIAGSQVELEEAGRLFEEALAIRRELGNKSGQATSLNNIGDVLVEKGDLAGARKRYEEAGSLAEAAGKKRTVAYSLFGLGQVELWAGNLAAARKKHEEALAIRTALGEKSAVAESQMALAAVALEEGRYAEADTSARAALERFETERAVPSQVQARSLITRIDLASGKMEEARQALRDLQRLADQAKSPRSLIAATIASLLAGRGEPRFEEVLRDAHRRGLVCNELELRCALGQAEVAFGAAESGRRRLRDVEREAHERGLGLIAKRAAAALRSPQG